MTTAKQFTTEAVTDSKRLIRGEHYLAAARLLRARSLERTTLRLLTLGGYSWSEDVASARHKSAFGEASQVYVVDKDPEVARLVNSSGIRGVAGCVADLFQVERVTTPKRPGEMYDKYERRFAESIEGLGQLDAVNLDFCSPVFRDTVDCVKLARQRLLTKGGVLIVTCSYGRDNRDYFVAAARGGVLEQPAFGEEDGLAGRVISLVPSAFSLKRVTTGKARENAGWRLMSVLVYRGKSAPMFSVLFQEGRTTPEENRDRLANALRVRDEDLRDTCVDEGPDSASLYGTPANRIIAWRAVATRRGTIGNPGQFPAQEIA